MGSTMEGTQRGTPPNGSRVEVTSPRHTSGSDLDGFLSRNFGERKFEFLRQHGDWWHSGDANRIVVMVDGSVAAYNGLIPLRCRMPGRTVDALWLVDVMVAPEYRGRGLQRHGDAEIRRRSPLVLGFPNALAAIIHRKHGWGVREDLHSILAPLHPTRVGGVRRRGLLVKAAAFAAQPLAALWRFRLRRFEPIRARRIEVPDVERWASIAACMPETTVTTLRDAAHLQRRYFDAPYRQELSFYECGELAMVTRRVHRDGNVEDRILDLFGDLTDQAGMVELLRLVLRDAARAGSVQVLALTSSRDLFSVFRKRGFLLHLTARFCWLSDDPELMALLRDSPQHWVLGDSDNDEP